LFEAAIGVIGGSGFYSMEAVKNPRYREIETPFGNPSEKMLTGEIAGHPVVFLSRHGIGHRYNPSEVNYRANLYAMKLLNVEKLISVTAVGSLKEELPPRSLVIPDQFMDFSRKRESTFFENGIVAHVSMAEPTCPCLSRIASDMANDIGLEVYSGGIYLNIEGPQFSTRAESEIYRRLGFSVIGMTQAVESKLARELEMCFLPLSFVTDYDCWHQESESVSVEMLIGNLKKNTDNANRLIRMIVESSNRDCGECLCKNSLKDAFITDLNVISPEAKKRLEPLLKKYMPV
jgi:5'-methylthioadenosine phosphorylase